MRRHHPGSRPTHLVHLPFYGRLCRPVGRGCLPDGLRDRLGDGRNDPVGIRQRHGAGCYASSQPVRCPSSRRVAKGAVAQRWRLRRFDVRRCHRSRRADASGRILWFHRRRRRCHRWRRWRRLNDRSRSRRRRSGGWWRLNDRSRSRRSVPRSCSFRRRAVREFPGQPGCSLGRGTLRLRRSCGHSAVGFIVCGRSRPPAALYRTGGRRSSASALLRGSFLRDVRCYC